MIEPSKHFQSLESPQGLTEPLGRGFLILFGGLSAYTFFDPNPNQKEEQQDENTSKMLGMRKEVYTCTFSEEYRVDGLDVKQRGPGITTAPAIQMGNFNIDNYTNETETCSWYAQYLSLIHI